MKTKYILMLWIILVFSISVKAQDFNDSFGDESINEVPAKWKAIKGTAVIGELGGIKVLKLDRYTVAKAVVDGKQNDYLGDQFTIEFDAFFSEVPTPTRQYYLIHLWDGTGVYGENGQHTDPYMIYRHGIRASGSFGNNKKIQELAVLEKTWRHVKVDYAQNTLKIFIDDQLIHHQPNLFYKPTMVSFSARNPVGANGITNIQIKGNGTQADAIDGLKIIVVVDNTTKKVKNIELFETMRDLRQVNEKYPKSSFYAGVLNGKYAVRTRILMDLEKPDWNNIMSTGNYTIEPAANSILSINTSQPYKPGGDFLPIKGARSFLNDQNVIPKDQFLASDQFGGNNQFSVGQDFNLGIINTAVLDNKDGIVVFRAGSNNPMGFEPIKGPTGEIITPTINTTDESEPFEPIQSPSGEIITPTINNEPYEPIDGTTTNEPIVLEMGEKPNYDMERINAAILHPNGEAFFFANESYYKYNLTSNKLIGYGSIGEKGWYGVEPNVDAAFIYPGNGFAYIFKGTHYFKYDFSQKKAVKKGIIGTDGWFGLPSNIDASIVHPITNTTYFFKENKYYRYNTKEDKVDKIGVINKDGWSGLPSNLDAAILHPNGKAYFFKGDIFYQFNFSTDKIEKQGIIGRDFLESLFIKIDAVALDINTFYYFTDRMCRVYKVESNGYNDGLRYVSTKSIGDETFYGIPDNVDAAFTITNERVIYIFKENKYYKYSLQYKKVIGSGVIGFDKFQGVPIDLDAAFYHNGHVIFTKDKLYFKYSYSEDKVVSKGNISSNLLIRSPSYIDAATQFGVAPNTGLEIPAIIYKKSWIYQLKSDSELTRINQKRDINMIYRTTEN